MRKLKNHWLLLLACLLTACILPACAAEEDTQRYRDLVDHTTRLYWGEDALSDIVWYTLGSYFAGDRTLDETIALIQNRVQLYVYENM